MEGPRIRGGPQRTAVVTGDESGAAPRRTHGSFPFLVARAVVERRLTMLPALRTGSALAQRSDRPANRLTNIFDQVFGPMDRFFDWDTDALASAWTGTPLTMWEDDDAVHVEVELP